MLATYATGKAIESNELKKTKVDNDAIASLLRSEISSHEMLVKHKKESLQQIEQEIAAEQTRIRELKEILASIEISLLQNEGDASDG